MKSVVCSAPEIRIACNQIDIYLDFLVGQMENYMEILSFVQENAIQDEKISAELSAIAKEVKVCANELKILYEDNIRMTVNRQISEISAADNFQYPHELLARISSFLASFL